MMPKEIEDPKSRPLLPDSTDLAPLECFDPGAFLADNAIDQSICDFVLMLALVYNDFKDIAWGLTQMHRCEQPNPINLNAYNGQFTGMNLHLTRRLHALVYELAELIKANPEILEADLFRKSLRLLRPPNRLRWQALVDFSHGKTTESGRELSKISMLVRHNISAHYYKPKFLSQGYRRFFEQKVDTAHCHAFVSRGASLRATRFYFADAAIDGCFDRLVGKKRLPNVRDTMGVVTDYINQTIHELVQKFVQARGFDIKPYQERT